MSRVLSALVIAAIAAFGATSAFAGQPASLAGVSIEVPSRSDASSSFAITVSLPRGTAAVEGRLLLDSSAAEVVGLASLGGGAALAPVEARGGYAFAAYNLRAANPSLRAVVVPHVAGRIAINVVIDAAADAAGRRIVLGGSGAHSISVGGSRARFGAPTASALHPLHAPVAVHDVVADGIVGKLDLDEVASAWEDAHTNDATCGPQLDSAADVNGDGCVDVVDLQAITAAKGQRFGGAALEPTSDTFALLGSSSTSDLAANTAGTITVNTTADTVDVKADDGVCADSHGRCSLRAAITTANWVHGPNTIAFNLTGPAPVLIQMDPTLSTLLINDRSGGTTIDGYTQPGSAVNTAVNGSNATPGVMIRGTGKNPRLVALRIVSANNVIRGLGFNNNYRSIVVENADAHDNLIVGNWIGFTAPGVTAKYNGHYNIWIADGASHNTVGTPALADRNVSGGAIKGLALYGPGTDFNTIQNNVFCITPNGLTSECAVGIDFSFGVKHNLIGGTVDRERNVFGRTRQNGIEFAHGVDQPGDETWHSDYNQIIDNWIGFRLNGSYDPSFRSGYIAPHDAANDSNGINIADGSSYNTAEGNFIGTVYDGINLMWANETGNTLRNNTIGIAPNGDPAPFARYGVNVRNTAHNHTIVSNIISNAGTYGIALVHKNDSSITISQNVITNMTGPAIYMVAGANGSIAPPTISSATTAGVSGKAVPGAKVEVFSASRNAGQSGLPTAYLGSATANASGSWSLAVMLTSGARVTATQTGANGNTSKLSTNASVGHGTATAPTADFTSQQQAGTLTVAFADTSTGGPATSWSWDFGDGSTSTQQNPSHTFASASTYNVKLVAGNSVGSSSVTKSVVVSSAATQPYVSDSFTRSASAGWGSAATGGAYTVTGDTANYRVANGAGSIRLPSANANASAILYGVTAHDVDIAFRIASDDVPAGGNVIVYAVARRVSTGEYRARISLNADSSVTISVSKLVGNSETRIGSPVIVPGLTVAAGSYTWLRARVTGASPTTIKVKAWAAGNAEPSGWQLSVTDSQAAIQGSGNVGFRLWLNSSVTNAPIQIGFDDYTVDPT